MQMHRKMRRKQPFAMLGLCLGLAPALGAGVALAEVESHDPIRITTHDWTGQVITATLMGKVLGKAGYNVEYVQADYLAQFAGLKTGDLDLAVEIWATTGQEALDEAVESGGVVNLGETGMSAIEEWWYPSYMEELCPGLPDWTALQDCADVFATPETAPKGRYLGGPVTWGGFDEERVEALDLDFEVVHAGTDGALFAELQSAYERKAPIILWLYSPHWAPVKFDGKFVQFPPYEAECYTDPAWGINPDMAYDCGKPTGAIWKAAWSGMEGKWPGAVKIAKNFTISTEAMGDLVYQVDIDGKDLGTVTDDWINANEAVWSTWLN